MKFSTPAAQLLIFLAGMAFNGNDSIANARKATMFVPIENHCFRIRLLPKAYLIGFRNDPNCDYVLPNGTYSPPSGFKPGRTKISKYDKQIGNVHYYKKIENVDGSKKGWSGTVTLVYDVQYSSPTLVSKTVDSSTNEFAVTVGYPDTTEAPSTAVSTEPTAALSNAPSAAPTVTKGYVSCGNTNKAGTAACTPYYTLVPLEERHTVRCCSDTSVPGWVNWDYLPVCNTVWGGSTINGSCHFDKTYQEAYDICDSIGARLCTLTELRNNCSAGSGCNADGTYIWSSTGLAPPATPAPTAKASATPSTTVTVAPTSAPNASPSGTASPTAMQFHFIRTTQGGKFCLTATQPVKTGVCSSAHPAQLWHYDATNGKIISKNSHMCIRRQSGTNFLVMDQCVNVPNGLFVYDNGRLKWGPNQGVATVGVKQCRAGTTLEVTVQGISANCIGQLWEFVYLTSAPTAAPTAAVTLAQFYRIRTTQGGKFCLTATQPVKTGVCSSAHPAQLWSYDATNGKIVNKNTMCIGRQSGTNFLVMDNCANVPNGLFVYDDGRLKWGPNQGVATVGVKQCRAGTTMEVTVQGISANCIGQIWEFDSP